MRYVVQAGWGEQDEERRLGAGDGIEGVFVGERSLPGRERYTFAGCDPAGPLRAALDGPAWLGNVWVEPSNSVDGQELLDVVVTGHRPSPAGDGLLDIDLEGVPYLDQDTRAPKLGRACRLELSAGEPLGTCRDPVGVFRDRHLPAWGPVILHDFAPTADPLAPGRRVLVKPVSAAGVESHWDLLHGDVEAVQGSDLIIRPYRTSEPSPVQLAEVWELWASGGPQERNQWARYDDATRTRWPYLMFRIRHPDLPAGRTFHLDGRFVTDLGGFYCALGEAVNGPGGYFGWNLGAVDDCLRGRWGVVPPWTLVWHDSDVARRHLVPAYDRRILRPAVTFDDLLDLLRERRIDVQLR
ncbi:barstar family protein [Dactylosporangium salmoneum]|uniref:Barstar (barnase inhibitor) domain-containing protein n=1 Tax=Dactylosporangium salmoneum TaxID=53361 RepID=A0ABN3HLX5_9ACTN